MLPNKIDHKNILLTRERDKTVYICIYNIMYTYMLVHNTPYLCCFLHKIGKEYFRKV